MLPVTYSRKERLDFQTFFGVDIRQYWCNITGFDVIKFDDFLLPPDGTSSADHLLAKFGDNAFHLVVSLMNRKAG